MQNKN